MFGSSSRSKVFQGSSKDLCQQRSFEGLRKSFEFKGRPRSFGRSSRWKPIQGSLRGRRDQRLFKGLRKFFDIEGHSRIFGRSLRSKIIQGPSEYLRYQISSKDLFVTVYRKTQDVTSEEQFCCFFACSEAGCKHHRRVFCFHHGCFQRFNGATNRRVIVFRTILSPLNRIYYTQNTHKLK